MSSEFVIWRYSSVRNAAMLTDLRGFDEINLFDTGEPLLAGFPADAAFHMDPDFPNDLLLPDNVGNSLQVALVSKRLAEVLQQEGTTGIELLPVRIIDHKGRVASDSHVIVHPVGLVDCIDMTQSVYKPSRFVEGNIDKVKKLVIDSARVPAQRTLFKMRGFGEPLIVRRSLADALDRAGFSGLSWLEVDQFPRR